MRTTIFIDASNYFISAKKFGIRIDPFKLIDHLSQGKSIVDVHYFNAHDPHNKSQARYHDKLKEKGVTVHLVDLLYRHKHAKCPNCGSTFKVPTHITKEIDIKMALEMIKRNDSYDELIMVSGDRDFFPVISYLRTDLGKKVLVASFRDAFSYVYKGNVDSLIILDRIIDRIKE